MNFVGWAEDEHMPDDGAVRLTLGDSRDIVISVHHDLASLGSLRDRWVELATKTDAAAAHSHDYVTVAWDLLSERSNVQLLIVSAMLGEDLLAIWPLYVEAIGGVRVAKHLGCGGDEEYAGPLVATHDLVESAVSEMLAALQLRVDVLKIYNLAEHGATAAALAGHTGLRHRSSVYSPVLMSPLNQSWDEWLATRSKSFRSGLKYDRKKLSQIGAVALCKIEDSAEIERIVGWIFDVKRASLMAHGTKSGWVFQPQGQQFFINVIKASKSVNAYALKVGDTIAAAAILLESRSTNEYYMTSYNHDLHAYSTGNLLLEDLIKRAFESGSVFDFRITGDGYKVRWTDATQRYDSYVVALSPRGRLSVAKHIAKHVAKRAEVELKTAIKTHWASAKQRLRRAEPA